MPRRIIRSCYTGRWCVGCYIWYSKEGPGRAAAPPSPLLAVPNVTTHPSMASVPITVLPLLCFFNVAIKWLRLLAAGVYMLLWVNGSNWQRFRSSSAALTLRYSQWLSDDMSTLAPYGLYNLCLGALVADVTLLSNSSVKVHDSRPRGWAVTGPCRVTCQGNASLVDCYVTVLMPVMLTL